MTHTCEEPTALPLSNITISVGNRDTAAKFVNAMKESFPLPYQWITTIEQEKYGDSFVLTVTGMSLDDIAKLLSLHQQVVT